MRPVSSQWADTVATSHHVVSSVRGEYAGEFTREIPILSGEIVYDRTAAGRRRCTLQVPLYGPDGFRYDPGNSPTHPLATNGQRVNIWLGVEHPDGTQEILNQGYYVLYSVSADDAAGIVTVTGMDLMQLWQDQKIVNEGAVIPAGASAKTLVTRLSYVALQSPSLPSAQITDVVYDTVLEDYTPSIRPPLTDGTDRMQPLGAILEDWPAAAAMNDLGQLYVYVPKTAPGSITAIIEGDTVTGTLVSRGREQSRRRMYNAVKVISRLPQNGNVIATLKAQKTTGPLRIDGPFGWVTLWHETTAVPVGPIGQRVADRLLAEGTLYTRTETVSAVPNPAIEIEDTVGVNTTAGGAFIGLVTAIRMPLTDEGGPMQITVTNEQGNA